MVFSDVPNRCARSTLRMYSPRAAAVLMMSAILAFRVFSRFGFNPSRQRLICACLCEMHISFAICRSLSPLACNLRVSFAAGLFCHPS